MTATSPAVSTPSEASLPDDLKIALVSTWPSFQAVHARSISHHSASQQIGLGVVNRPARGRVLGGCHTLVNGSTAESLWHSGDWQINAFSSDGRFGVGRSVMYGTIGIIDLNTDKLVLGINPDMTPVGPDMIFDEANRLNFTVGNPASGGPIETSFAFMACDLAGQCWLSTARYADPTTSYCRTASDGSG